MRIGCLGAYPRPSVVQEPTGYETVMHNNHVCVTWTKMAMQLSAKEWKVRPDPKN